MIVTFKHYRIKGLTITVEVYGNFNYEYQYHQDAYRILRQAGVDTDDWRIT